MRTASALLIAGITLLALTSCGVDHTPVIPNPSPSSSPIFDSDEEALAAAEEAYAAYLAVIDEIHADGGANPSRLDAVATSEVTEKEAQGFEDLAARGHHTVGQTTYDSVSLQEYDNAAAGGNGVVFIYVCEDFSNTDVVDKTGQSVLGPDRRLRWPLVVGFDLTDGSSLLVSSVEDWSGADFCEQ